MLAGYVYEPFYAPLSPLLFTENLDRKRREKLDGYRAARTTALEALRAKLDSLQSADAVASAVGQAIALTGRPEATNDFYAAYDRVTSADLQRVAGRYFAPKNRTVITLTSETKP